MLFVSGELSPILLDLLLNEHWHWLSIDLSLGRIHEFPHSLSQFENLLSALQIHRLHRYLKTLKIVTLHESISGKLYQSKAEVVKVF